METRERWKSEEIVGPRARNHVQPETLSELRPDFTQKEFECQKIRQVRE